MLLGRNGDSVFARLELKKGDHSCLHKSSCNGSANQQGKFGCADSKVLLYLHNAEFVVTAFGLNREDVMSTLLVHPNVNFISFDLTHLWHGGAKVVLKRIAGDTAENINQPVVSHFCEERLFIIKGVFGNDPWRR